MSQGSLLDRICLSLDGASADTFRAICEGGELGDLESALAALAAAREVSGRTRPTPASALSTSAPTRPST